MLQRGRQAGKRLPASCPAAGEHNRTAVTYVPAASYASQCQSIPYPQGGRTKT
ncbi:MAG: hypothetical protein LBF62_15190 [Tannerellaceae bacterium]|nr:hypothetical protein [Tannerellaceae bacterium]